MASILALLALSASAATIAVPGDAPDLPAAVAAATSGDTIEVASGTWRDVVLVDKDLTIVGTAGSGSTTLSNTGFDDVLTIEGGAVVVVEGFTFDPSVSGRAVDVSNGVLTLRDVIVRGNSVSDRPGAALRVRSGATLTVEDSILDGNAANNQPGGHVHAEGATLVMRRTLMVDGNADEGGAIFAATTRVTLEDCELRSNEAGGGGAILLEGSTLTASATLFDGNRAVSDWSDPNGGAVLLRQSSIATFEDCQLTGNLSDSRGGAVDVDDGVVTVVRGAVEGNQAGYGGAFYVDGGELVLTDTVVSENSATAGSGGGVRFRADGGSLSVTGTAFVGNHTTDGGGAIGLLTLGGPAAVDISLSRFDENTADGEGGALDLGTLTGTIVANRFCLNQAANGAAVRVSGAAGLWTNNRFQHNAATGFGGGIRVAPGADIEVINNTFVANRAVEGGALSATDAAVRFVNNAVAYQGDGGGVSAENVAGALTYSLFWDNTPADLSPNLAAMVGADVRFAEPGFTSFTDDLDCNDDELWPEVGSPLIDQGEPTLLDANGTRSDIGAYGGPSAEVLPGEDGDGDGYGEGVDCDDDDPTIHPGAEEDCSSVDRDCSGDPYDAPDGGTWYVDDDGDGFGVPGDAVTGCEQPEGYAGNDDDCDDGDPDVNPDAEERCNGRDDTCNGLVDEGLGDEWYVDADGDGYGAGELIDQCDPAAGLVDRDGDCDDADPAVHPGAEDADGDGIDSDCDGADGAATTDPVADEPIQAYGDCGCATGSAGGWLLWLPLLAVGRRR